MRIQADTAERNAILATAQAMAAAARTAPKTRGIDYLETLILTDEDLQLLAETMEKLGEKYGLSFIVRDAENVRNSTAVLLLGIGHHYRGLNEACQYCGSRDCTEAESKKNSCVYDPIDLGIAIGSAVGVAASAHIDNRVMFSVGIGARELKLFDESIQIIVGIPLSAKGKSIYFDRTTGK